MSDFNETVTRYIAVWNETDPTARRAAIEALFAEDAAYTDPMCDVAGHDQLDSTVAAVQAQFPGFVFTLAGPVDAHHDMARFTWTLGPAGQEAPIVGFDVAVLAADGRIGRVHGFLDKVPSA